jgi:hypothetical protein
VKVRWLALAQYRAEYYFWGIAGYHFWGMIVARESCIVKNGGGISIKPPLKASLWRGRLKASTTDEGAPSQ